MAQRAVDCGNSRSSALTVYRIASADWRPWRPGRLVYYTPRRTGPRRAPARTPPTLGQMVWVPPEHLNFGSGSGHEDRPAYSVTPGGRGLIFWVLPCTSGPLGSMERFFQLWTIHFATQGDRPNRVFARTWIFERAEKLDFRATGPLARYVTLTRDMIDKPFAWWRDRGMPRRDQAE